MQSTLQSDLEKYKLFSHQSIADLTWSIIASAGSQQILTRRGMIVITLMEGAISIFYALLMVAKLQCNFLRERLNDWNISNKQCVGSQISRTSIIPLRQYLNTVEDHGITIVNYISVVILLFNLCLIMLLVILLKQKLLAKESQSSQSQLPNANKNSSTSIIESILCFILVFHGRFLYIPIFEILARSFLSSTTALMGGMAILQQMINIFALFTQIIVILYANRLLTLNMPSPDFASWSTSSSSNLEYLKIFAKIATPLILVADRNDNNIGIFLIGNLCLQSLYLIFSLYVTSTLDHNQALIQKITQSTIVVVLEIGVVSFIMGQHGNNNELFLIILLIIFQSYSVQQWSRQRCLNLIDRFKQGGANQIKLEIECEQTVLYIIRLCESVLEMNLNDVNSMVNSEEFSQLISLWEKHSERCKKDLKTHCQCRKIEEYVKLFRECMRNGVQSDFIKIQKSKINKHYKLISQDIDCNYNYVSRMTYLIDYNKRIKEQQIKLAASNDDVYESSKEYVTISIEGVKKRLIDLILNFSLAEIRNQFPRSLKLYELGLFSRVAFIRQPYSCLNIMRTFQEERNLSFFDTISKTVNDLYILSRLSLLDQHFQYQSSLSACPLQKVESNQIMNKAEDINIDHFIRLDILQMRFTDGIDVLKLYSQEFWTNFSDSKTIIDPNQALIKGYQFANQIKLLDRYFQELDSAMIRKDPKVYFKFAKVHKIFLNDDVQYALITQKMRNIQEMRNIYNRNRDISTFEEDCPFAIVDANANRVGTVILMNESCQQLIGRSANETVGLKINSIMPSLIGIYHDSFINAFNQNAKTKILNQTSIQQIVDRQGFIISVQFLAKMHYSHSHGICFFGLLRPIPTMIPFLNGYTYPTNQLGVLTFGLDDGRIYEISKGFSELMIQVLHQQGVNNNATKIFKEKSIAIDEILIDFHFQEYKRKFEHTIKKGIENSSFDYEQVHNLDTSLIQDLFSLNRHSKKRIRNNVQVRVCIRSEQHNKGQVRIGYAIMIIEETQNDNESEIQQSLFLSTRKQDNQTSIKDEEINNSAEESGSTCSNSNQISIDQIRKAGKSQSVPKTLKIVIQLVLVLFFVSSIIATINLSLNIQNKFQEATTAQSARLHFARMNFTSNSRLILRSLINMANGYEPMNSTMIEDRWGFYTNMLSKINDQLKNVQNLIDTNPIGYHESMQYQYLKHAKNIKIQQINGEYVKSSYNTTYSQAVNLYTAKIQQLNQGNQSTLKGNLYLQKLNPSINYLPTYEEQMIYFTLINSNGVLRQYNWVHAFQIVNDSAVTSDYFSSISLITTLVSILSIFAVILAVSPIISKTEERRYLALTFFLKIPFDKRVEFLQSCREFNNQQETTNQRDDNSSEIGSSSYMSSQYESIEVMQSDSHIISANLNNPDTFAKGLSTGLIPNDSYTFGRKYSQTSLKLNEKQIISPHQIILKDESSASNIVDEQLQIEDSSLDSIERIKQVAKWKRNQSLVQQVFAIIIFTGYFLGSYFMSINNFNASQQSVIDLNTILFKEVCFENIITFLRENQIRNESVTMSEDGITYASQSLINSCKMRENQYHQLRRNTPKHLAGAKAVIIDIESQDLCEKTFFSADEIEILAKCKNAINGLLSTGISNSLSYMYRQAESIQSSFDSSLKENVRNEEYLRKQMWNPDTVEMIDVKLYLFSRPFEILKSTAMQSIDDYFTKTMNEMIALYSVFMVFLISCLLAFFIFIIQRLRETMWNTNLLLRVIPAQTVFDKNIQTELVQFYIT